MALTPDEQERLDYINDRLAEIDQEKQGRKAVETFKSHTRPEQPADPSETRPFSLTRSILGGIRDAFNSPLEIGAELDDYLKMPSLALGSAADNGIIGINSASERKAKGQKEVQFQQLEGSDRAGGAEQLVRGLVGFTVPFVGALKATSGLRAVPLLGRAIAGAEGASELTFAGRVVQGAAAGAVADFVQEDPVGGNMANVLKDTFGLDNAMLDSLAAEEDDNRLTTRLKAAAAGMPIGIAGDAIFEAGAKGLRAYRAWKGTMEQNAAIVDSFAKGPVRLLDAHDAAGAEAPAKRLKVRGLKGRVGSVELDPGTFTSMDEVLGFLKKQAGDIAMNEDDLQRFAANLAEGEPENALARMGIDPAKIDFAAYRDPEALARLHKGLAEVYEGLAERLGRSGIRVSEQETIRGAEALASTPEVLRSLYGSTRGLAEKIMASRMIVGAHGHQLLDRAKAALAELEQSGPGEAWAQFMESFENHAYLMGALRGAGSEVGRALRSLQTIVKVSRKKAAKIIDKAEEADAKAAASETASTVSVVDGASQFAKLLETDAEKVRALKRLIDLKGDVSELSRTVREGNNTGLSRVSEATKEIMGSMFSSVTAATNALSSMGFLALNALGRYAAAGVRSALGLVSDAAAIEARRARLEAWAITEGIIGGFRPAFSATIGVLKREFLSEASINLDGLGLEQLAKKSAIGSAKAEAEIAQHFERSDVVSHKAFAMTASERKVWEAKIEELDGPRFFKAGLKGLLRTAGAAVNVAGSGYRAGTTLFINAPDEFMGTVATRAGAMQSAVRLSAKEARHLGLEGKEFSEFVKARSQTLYGNGPAGWAADSEMAGLQHVMARAGTVEAKMILFQDDLELKFNKAIAQLHNSGGGFATLIVPFIKTPLRILERTALDFTPLGLMSGRLRKAIVAGGSQADEALARMSLGMVAMVTAYQLAEDRQIVGFDGGYLSTARDAGRKSYSLKIGDDTFEFKRYDPIGTLLGFGADLRQHLEAHADDPEGQSQAMEMFKATLFAVTANVLSKSWLTSIKDLTDLAGATSSDDFDLRLQRFWKSYANRAIPGAGVQRMVEGWGDGYLREATTFNEAIWRNSIGASSLPVQRDYLGRPVEHSATERVLGVPGGIMPFEGDDPVMTEMERLSFRKPASERKQNGVKLNAAQFSRFLELRGQIVKDETGLTMDQKLKVLIQSDGYKSLPSDAAKEAAIRSSVRGYNSLASAQLTREDPNFAQARLKDYIFKQATLQGWTPEQRDQTLTQQSSALAAWLQHQQQ